MQELAELSELLISYLVANLNCFRHDAGWLR